MVKAVDGVDLAVAAGETLALLGETGSGKTVLGLAVVGLLPPNVLLEGEILYRQKKLLSLPKGEMRRVRGREIAMIMQNPLSSLNPSLTVGEQIAEAVRKHRRVSGREAWVEAKNVLEQTGIPASRAHHYPHQFSGGMRQRAMIALGLACQPSLLIADEPTKGLDVTVQFQIVELLRFLPGRTGYAGSMLLITHDLGAADLKVLRRKLRMIFQEPDGSLDPRWRTARSLAEPFRLHRLLPEKKIAERVGELLNIMGLHPEHLNRYPFELSGGQLQRISLARDLALEPELIVADEPTSSLDVSMQAQILCLLKELQQKLNLTILFITHDLYVARQMCQRVAVMYRDAMLEEGDTETVFENPGHPYTRLLLDSLLLPDPGARKSRPAAKVSFSGTEPEQTYVDRRGCLFQHRCKLKDFLCEQQKPEFVFIDKGHRVACHKVAFCSNPQKGSDLRRLKL